MGGLLSGKSGSNVSTAQVVERLKKAMNSGKPLIDAGFTSHGSAKGTGFGGEFIINTYCPKGTKMIYSEPFSAYGYGGKDWEGKKVPYKNLGSELETIVQRGTGYRITKVQESNGKVYVDMEVVSQINS